MGEHTEDMAKTWNVSRQQQDALALESHQRAVAAQDRGFFADLIKTRTYARADREKGRFRSFLLGALKHFIADVRDRGQALKRGGGMILVNLDDKAIAEAEAQIARATNWQADYVYDREWAACLLRQALNRLAQECALAGKHAKVLHHIDKAA